MSAYVNVKIQEEEELLPERIRPSRMYRIPSTEGYMDRDFADVYEPYKVSIGPVSLVPRHTRSKEEEKKKEELKKGEEVKNDCVQHFLMGSGKPFESYLPDLKVVVDELGLRDAYDGLDKWWQDNTEAVLWTILLDACFLLEFIYTMRDVKSTNPTISRILENREEKKSYLHDILLLENQIPLKLLESLRKLGGWGSDSTEDDRIELLKVIANGFTPVDRVPKIERMYNCGEFENSLHILDVYRRVLVHRDFKSGKPPKRRNSPILDTVLKYCPCTSLFQQEENTKEKKFTITNIPSATELSKIGIRFTTSDTTSLLDISLVRKTLRLPTIVIDGSTKSTFLNLIAFEQLHKDIATKNEVTAYMYFMGCLVQQADDARLLQSHDIIVTTLPAYEVTKLFRRMSRNISLEPDDPLAEEYKEMLTILRAQFNKKSNEWRKDLFQTYLRSPWAIMSVVAAILLFTLSIIQTVYTVLSCVRPK